MKFRKNNVPSSHFYFWAMLGSGISPVSANRNALAVINEIRPGLAWKVNFEQEQMINKFFASIIIDGEEFTGRGKLY